MTLISRVGDFTIGYSCIPPGTCGGIIVSGASKTVVEGSNPSRVGDIVIATCGGTGVISSGASKTFIEGSQVSRAGDSFSGCYSGIIVGSCSKTHAE